MTYVPKAVDRVTHYLKTTKQICLFSFLVKTLKILLGLEIRSNLDTNIDRLVDTAIQEIVEYIEKNIKDSNFNFLDIEVAGVDVTIT